MSSTIGNRLPNYNLRQSRINPTSDESTAPAAQKELSPVEDKVTISSNTLMGRILSGISSMSSQELGQIHRLDPAMVGSLLAD